MYHVVSFRKISVDIIPNIPINERFTVLVLVCLQFKADEDLHVKL